MLPADYGERVYAGVLGKIIGVYLGRPFEGWSYERIMSELGEIEYYVNDRMPGSPPLVVTDDDISGTFTFLRALPDYGNSPDITPRQIGQTWLNYIIEQRTILWWGGLGNSTEHTAYLRLKNGIAAPESGSIGTNGALVAEQIGAQIFIDGWAMVSPGDPERAAELAGRAASVSHDGEAIYGAQVLAAMQAQAFVESDIDKLLDVGVSVIPQDSVIYRMIGDIRAWHAGEVDWHKGYREMAGTYNYANYGGNCHMVPNHGLIILGLLYGNGDIGESLKVVNTTGWDTDCNSGNLGCLLGIRGGLGAFENGKDWRGPVADRLIVSAADGGRAITDAVIEAQHIASIGHALAGEEWTAPKNGARFHFEFPGSVQGFVAEGAGAAIANVAGGSAAGTRALQIRSRGPVAVVTATFTQPDQLGASHYQLLASPTLYSGQKLRMGLSLAASARTAVEVRPIVRVYNDVGELETVQGERVAAPPGESISIEWVVPDTGGQPIAQVGLECAAGGTLFLDYLDWSGAPRIVLQRPATPTSLALAGEAGLGEVWRRAWVSGVDVWTERGRLAYNLSHNSGRGVLMQGARSWQDYEVEATITPIFFAAGGIAARVQGMRRMYALLLAAPDSVRLVKALDGDTVLARSEVPWSADTPCALRLRVTGNRIEGWVDGKRVIDVVDTDAPLTGGGVGFVLDEGHLLADAISVSPVA